jgi:AraC family transcriptional regulator
MFKPASSATILASVSGGERDRLDSEMLSKLLVAASATLDTDVVAAKACLQQAADLLHGCRAPAGPRVPGSSVVQGGLAPWQKKRVTAYVEANMSSSIRAGDLAEVAHLSIGHFFRAFRQSFGEPPLVYVARQRVRRSQALMRNSQAPLSQIALECGMSDQPHFTRVFRRIVGVNPGAWRRQFTDKTTRAAAQGLGNRAAQGRNESTLRVPRPAGAEAEP